MKMIQVHKYVSAFVWSLFAGSVVFEYAGLIRTSRLEEPYAAEKVALGKWGEPRGCYKFKSRESLEVRAFESTFRNRFSLKNCLFQYMNNA
jgi:hypothetical protein